MVKVVPLYSIYSYWVDSNCLGAGGRVEDAGKAGAGGARGRAAVARSYMKRGESGNSTQTWLCGRRLGGCDDGPPEPKCSYRPRDCNALRSWTWKGTMAA